MNPELIIVSPSYKEHIALIQLNRPKELNALNLQVMGEIRDALKSVRRRRFRSCDHHYWK